MTDKLLLEQAIGSERFQVVAGDPASFVEAFDDGRKPFEHQAEAMRTVVERKPDEKFAKRVQLISWPRQNGKSQTSAWLGCHQLFTASDANLLVSVALDRESARIIFDEAKRLIEGNQILRSLVDPDWGITRSEVRLRDGRRWIIRSADGRLSRGLSPDIVLFDELGWSQDDGNLYQVLQAGQAARPNPLTIITSTVSPVKDGPLWDLFESAKRNDPAVGLIYRTDNPSPMITTEFLEEQEALLPSTIFAREHRNEWTEGGDVFSTEADWLKAISRGDPTRASSAGPTYAFLDLGWVHDESVLSIIERNEELETWDVVHMQGWRGSQKKPVDLPGIRETIRGLVPVYGIKYLEIESPQGVAMSQELDDISGLTVTFLHPTNLSNAERYGALYRALKEGKLRLPDDPLLRRQLLTMVIGQVGSGENWRIESRRDVHNDRAVSVAGSLFLGIQSTLAPKWKNIKFLAMTPDGPVSGPDLTPLKQRRSREPFVDHIPGVRRIGGGSLPVTGGELVASQEAWEVQNIPPGKRVRIEQTARILLRQNTTLAKLPHLLARQFSMTHKQIRAVLKELYDESD